MGTLFQPKQTQNLKAIPDQEKNTATSSKLVLTPLATCNTKVVHFSFGFRDGLSQPLLKGINSPETLKADPYMQTNQNIITITSNPPGTQDGIEAYPKERPSWMVNGSFLAFRKLEQDVQKWIDLVNKFADAGCKNADHCGAKLMGRWKSGEYQTFSRHHRCFSGDK